MRVPSRSLAVELIGRPDPPDLYPLISLFRARRKIVKPIRPAADTIQCPALPNIAGPGGLSSYRRIAMMLGLPPDTHPRELVKIGRNILAGSIPPKIVKHGPVKENVITGKDIDLYEFPVPYWNRLDGGRYIMTYGGSV